MYKIKKHTKLYISIIEEEFVFVGRNMGINDGAESLPIVLELNVADIGTGSVLEPIKYIYILEKIIAVYSLFFDRYWLGLCKCQYYGRHFLTPSEQPQCSLKIKLRKILKKYV